MTIEPRPDPSEDFEVSAAFIVPFPVLMILLMILIGEFIGFGGAFGVFIALIASAVISAICSIFLAAFFTNLAGTQTNDPPPLAPSETPSSSSHTSERTASRPKVEGPPPSQSQPSPNVAGTSTPTSHPNNASGTWRAHLCRHEPEVERELRNIELMIRERPEFTGIQQEKVLDAVARFSQHHRHQQHILEDTSHPDHAMVTREMGRYRRTVVKLLQLRQDELATGAYGGFDYREDLRAAEGMVEVLQDEFEQLRRDAESP
ncbi:MULTISPECIES: hypothetical protein [Actinomycetes]|uniref:Uncharacterized protein n=2 Tax=Actinomycetes TaxID=1760 RepID=A0ABP6LPH9_9MICC